MEPHPWVHLGDVRCYVETPRERINRLERELVIAKLKLRYSELREELTEIRTTAANLGITL